MWNTVRLTLPPASSFFSIQFWTPQRIAVAAINLIMIIAVVIFFFSLLIGGLRYVMAGGNKESTQGATRQMFGAFIGLIIVLSVYAVMTLASSFLGIPLLNFTIINI